MSRQSQAMLDLIPQLRRYARSLTRQDGSVVTFDRRY